MDYRQEAFKKKFEDAGRHLGVAPREIISLKFRDNVNSYSIYHEFLHVLEHEAGIQHSKIDGDLRGQGYLLSGNNSRAIIVEHETGLEILYVAGSIASLVSIIPLVLQGWRAFRGRHAGRHDFHNQGIELRRLDENGNLIEEPFRDRGEFTQIPFIINKGIASAANAMEEDLHRLKKQIESLNRRIDDLGKQSTPPMKSRKRLTKKKKAVKKTTKSSSP
jgi:hypothetical protein